jgi:gliding motility-associated-like protein/fimbrial isopeptide formation D2 family protein/uncharacterized repeat protein (TIGR01451 family)
MKIQRHLFRWILYSFLCCTVGLVQAQIPTLTNATPAEGFIGEQVCFPVTFVNIGAPAYSPYVRLILPVGFTFDNSSFNGAVQSVQNLGVIVAAAPNNFVVDPVAQSNGNTTTNDTIFAPIGSTIILLEYPVGSMVQGGFSLISEVCVTVDTGATIDIPVDICTQGMYGLGDSPIGNNGPIAGANVCEPIIPILFQFDKKINGSDGVYNEVPGGGLCHVHQYQLNVDIAAAGTLNGPITITDVLPGVLTYLGNISLPAGCSAVEPTVGGLGGTLTITCTGAYPGSTANIDLQVTFDAAVSDTLDETICDDADITNSASMSIPGSPSQSDSVATDVGHVLLGHVNNAASPVTIGQTVTYSISAEITEYTAGLNAASITFVVPDGMVYNSASLTWAGTPVLAGNIAIVAGPGTGSTVTVDVHTQNGANVLPCGSPVLQYTADVNPTYSNGNPVLSRDRLNHSSALIYDLVEGATGCMTSAQTFIEVVDISFQKTVTNSPPTGPVRNGQWWPGDIVQYRLELQIPSLDLNDVVITDFFPLPIHDVSSLAATFGTDVRFDPATCWINAPVSYTRDVARNSLVLDFGDVSNSVTGGCVDIVLLIDIPITTVPLANGLFHSNFMQVNSDNSTGDDITGNSLTLIQVGAPDLELTKGIVSSDNPNVNISPTVVPPNGNATGVNAGDQLFFDITVANVGGAPGYNVQIRDVAPPELTNCALIAPNPVVDGSSNVLAFSGGFAGNTLTIDLIAPNDSIAFAGASGNNHLMTVSYVCEAVSGVQAGTQFDNTAEVDWSSIRGGSKFPPVDDDASGVIADPTMNKIVDYIFPNYSNTNTQASIGEVVAYEVQLNIPEGNMNNVMMVDELGEGLAFVGVDSILICNSSGSINITTSIGGGFAAVQSGAAITNTGTNPQQQDRVLTLDFGNLQNLDTDNVEDTIKVFYRTIVINHVTNVDGERVRNRAVLSWDNPNNTGGTSSINDRAPFVTIVEPQIEISKSFTPDEVLPGNNSFVTLTLRNPGTSTAPAFDVNLTDILPTGMIFVSGFSAGGTANITTPPTNGGGTITAHWDTLNVGEVYSVTFEVQSSSFITPCFTLTNCANVTWESIAEADEPNMPTAFSSNLGIKRTGNPGNIGGVANTHTQDSCADLDIVIDNTFDPFITANTPLCEGDRVVLSVQQYQGNVVTYNWTGPGVPVGFNNYELVLDPVTAADVGTYFVFVELDGCVTDSSNSFSLQLRPKPVTPNINPGDTTICEGTSIQYSTTTIANTYTWTGPNGFTANSATTPLISPVTLADAGRYTLFTTNSQGCNSDPISSNLMVTPRPAQPSLGNNTPICSNENIVLTSSASVTTYQWLSPNGQDTITTSNTLILGSNNPLYTAGNWTLVVFDANSCASEASNVTTVIINGTPVAPITSNSGPICEGDDVTLMVNTVSNGAYAWYSDAALTNLVASTQNPVISGLLAANSPDTFYVQVSSNTCRSDTGLTVVQINANPATVTPNYTPLCSGDTIFLFSNSVATTYSWTGPNGFLSNLENPFIANSASSNAGSYTLSITDANGCSNSGIVQVAVDESPTTPSITSNGPVCEGDDIVLNIATYTGSTVQYTWSTPVGIITTGVPSLNVNNTTVADSGIYSVVVAVDGCISLADSIHVVINSNPTAANVPAAFAVCEGDGITLSTTTNANVYNWSGPNGFASSSPNPSVISPASAANAGTYTLVVQDFNGCTSPDSNIVVTFNPAPAQPAMSTNSAICMGDNLVLSTGAIATSYTWTAPNGADTTTATSTATIGSTNSLYQSGNWNLVVVNVNGCSSPVSIPSMVTINNGVTAVAFNNGAICSGDAVQLSTTTVNSALYEWYSDAALTNLISTQQNPIITNITTDSTFLLVVTVNGCASIAVATTVTLNPALGTPNVPVSFVICEGGIITLTTTTNAANYNWTGPNGFTSNLQSPAVISPATIADAGIYTLSIVDVNGCQSADTSITVGVDIAPAAAVLINNSARCEGDTLILSTTANADTFRWMSPNGMDTITTVSSLVIVPSNTTYYQSGDWTLITQIANNCPSQPSAASSVVINSSTTAPNVFNNGPVCVGGDVILSTASASGASYQWYTDAALTNLVATTASFTATNITQDSTFYLVVTVSGCISPAGSTLISVIGQPAAPAVPADFDVCQGDNIVLSSSTVANSYSWTGPNGFSSNLQTPTVITNASFVDSGAYHLVVTYSNGCVSGDTIVRVIVNGNPPVPNVLSNSPLCFGDTLILSSSTGCDQSQWIGPNGNSQSTLGTFGGGNLLWTLGSATSIPVDDVNYLPGNWSMICIDTLTGCRTESNTIDVIINANPDTPNVFNDGPVCNGATANLTTATVAGATYAWFSDAALTNLVATAQNPSIVNLTSDTTWHLVVTVNGCSSVASPTIVIVHPAPPTPNVPAYSAVCEGVNIILTTNTVAAAYNWSGPNGFMSNVQNPVVIANATTVNAGVYTLSIVDANGCRSGDTSVLVSVNANPASVTINSNSPICFGDTLTLTSSSDCGQSQWIGPNGNSASTLGTVGGGNVLWTIGSTTNIPSTDANYLPGDWSMICVDTITGCRSESNTITINITPIPSTPAAFNNSPVCVGGTVQLTTTTVSNGSYAWYADSTLTTLVATSQNPTIANITTDSTFYIVVTVNTCASLTGSTNISVHPVPATPNVPANFVVCAGDNIVLSTTTNATGYNWTGPNGFSSTLQNPSVVNATLIDSGTYTLFIIDANGCLSGDTSVQVSVNPNPAQPVLSSNSAICNGDSLVLSTTATATTYRWIAPDGSDTLTGVSNLVVLSSSAFYQEGNWTLMIINVNGCQSILSNPEPVIINSIPATQIVFNDGPVCNGSSVNLSTSFITGATYEWYSDTALTNLVGTSQNTTINNITTDSTFYLVITVNGCTSVAGSTTVQVHPTPATPNVPANITACEGDALVLTTTTNASTYIWSGPNGFNSNQQSPTVINTASVVDSGTYTLYIIDANGCRSADTTVQVIVNPTPATPFIVSNNSPVCEGDDLILSVNVGVLGTTYEWFSVSNVSVGTGQTLTIVGATVVNAGAYYVITTVNACLSAASNVTTAIVDPIPNTAAFAGNDIGLCNTFTTNLDATPPSNATGMWTTASGATIANPNLANTAVYNLPTGANTFYWTLTNGACSDFSIDSMIVDVTPISIDVADAGLDQNLCGQTGAILVATTPTVGTGQWTQSAIQGVQGVVLTNPTNPNTTVTGLLQGNNYSFTWTLSNGNCVNYSTDMIQINVDVAPPDHAYAGVNILLCNQNTANLDAFVSQYGTGVWTSTSTATLIDPTLANTTVINLPQDTSVFVWTLSNGTCLNYSIDSVLVVVSSTTDIAEAGNNQVVCSVNSLTFGATMPSAGIGTWSQTSVQAAQGVVLVDVNDPNTQVVGLNTGTTYAFTWTLSNGTCQDYSSDITTITVNSTPPDNAFAGNDINLCGVTTTTNLAASVPTVAIGFWTTMSTATISNPTQSGSTVSGLVVGQNIFVWTLSNGTCQDYDNDTIIITVTTPSGDLAEAGLDSAYCAQSVIALNAAAPSVGGGYWSQTPSQASLGSVIDNPTDTSSTVSNLMAGVTYIFTWTLTNGGCVDYSSDQVLITIDVLPSNVAYAGEDTILCGGNAVELNGLAPPIGTGFWTTNDMATIVTPVDPTSLVVNIGQDTSMYYWTLSNGACVDYSVDSMTVIISPASTDLAFAGYDEVLCVLDSITLSGGTPTTSTGLWTQSAGQSSQGVIITNLTDPNSTVRGIQTGQVYTFTWTLSTFGCANFSTDNVQYTINALPTEVAYAGPDIVLCSGNTVIMDAANPIFSTGIWSSNSSAIIVNPTLNNSSIVTIPTDTVVFYWALSNGSCIDYSIDSMLIIVTPTFSVDTANAGLDINLCNEDTAQLMAIAPSVAIGRWTQPFNQSSAGVVLTNPNAVLTTATGLRLDSTYTFIWSVSNGPCQDYDTDQMTVQVSTLPTDAAYAGEDFVICGIDTAIVNATAPSIGMGLWTTPSTAIIVTPTNIRTELLNLSVGTNEVIWTLSNGACIDYSSDTIRITMDSAPIANADSVVVIYNSNGTTIDVTPNDNLNNNWSITISEPINSGTLTNLGTGEFDILLQDVLVDQTFIYELCNPSCPAIYCDTAVVILDVQGGTICDLPNMITPNNDGTNETFIVPCLDGLEGTKFAVYNRWGDSMYENDNYKNDWGGTYNGAPVPDATYFYIMELADGQRFQGFVEVRR